MPLPQAPEEREQGAVQAQEALEAAAPPPLEESPAAADEQVVEAAIAQAGDVAPPAQQAAPTQRGYVVKNPYTLLPPAANYRGVGGNMPKSKVQRRYDIGLFWQVLASDPNASPLTRTVARSLVGKKR